MELGIYFTKTEPTKGLKIPWVHVKWDIPGITANWLVLQFGSLVVYIAATV